MSRSRSTVISVQRYLQHIRWPICCAATLAAITSLPLMFRKCRSASLLVSCLSSQPVKDACSFLAAPVRKRKRERELLWRRPYHPEWTHVPPGTTDSHVDLMRSRQHTQTPYTYFPRLYVSCSCTLCLFICPMTVDGSTSVQSIDQVFPFVRLSIWCFTVASFRHYWSAITIKCLYCS